MVSFVSLNPTLTLVVVALVSVSALTLLEGRRRMARGFRLPPGPTHFPLVGNLFNIDAKKPWITYAKWAARYAIGGIFRIRVLKQDVIVIASKKIAKDLLDRRSRIYSDRPHLATLEPFGWSFNFAWAQYGDRWRSQRRIFQQVFRPEATLNFRPTQLTKARQLVLDILSSPHDFCKHIQRFSAGIMMSIVYDYEVASDHDHFVELFERGTPLAMEGLTLETASVVDAFPFLLGLPKWSPGGFLGRKAVVSNNCATQMIAEPFEYARERKAVGSTASAMALDLLPVTGEVDDPLRFSLSKDTCATAFVAGAETTSSTLKYFVLAMLQHPEVQERAHAEIDAVIGINRLPTFDDRPNLPYTEAILKEILRLYAIAPLALPHCTTADDIYEDMIIPKGSVVVPNIWAMHHDEDDYPEPDVFKPERFIVDGKLSGDKFVDSLAFGFGRRVCPGRHAADGSIWAGIVSILHALKISKVLNEQGKELDFEPTYSTGVTTHPDPFPCSITPRSVNIKLPKENI